MRLLHLIEDNTMKIDEVQIQEAEPNYETDPAQARLSAIAVKLMDKAETVTDENLQIALSRVATHLPEYGTAFGAKNMQELLDIVNGEGRYAPDPDMPQDNKNPIKITKDSLMKMMAYGQKMVDKEGTVKVDVKEAETTVKGKPYSAAKSKAQLRVLSEARRMLENEIIKLADLDNGDLTDQLQTIFDANTKMSGAIRRAYNIIPESVEESSFGDRSMAAIQMKRDRIAKDVDAGMSMDAIVGKYANKRTDNTDDIRKIVRDYKFKKRMKNEAAIPTSEYDYDLRKFLDKVQELEDQNQHGEVAAMVTQMYGTDPENMVIRGINGMHAKQGSITRTQQQLRDEISNKYYKKLESEVEGMKEGVISDLFKASTAEKRAKEQTASAYDAMRLEKETKKFEKQGLSPEDARKYAYRKVYGAPK
jgi:hypothetical protein